MYFSLKEKVGMGNTNWRGKVKKNVITLVLAFICISKQREHMREHKKKHLFYIGCSTSWWEWFSVEVKTGTSYFRL